MSIEFKDGAVCYASEVFWLATEKHEGCLVDCYGSVVRAGYVINIKDFQLNTIKQGDYIEASELDTEQKYNDAVKVFELFGYERSVGYNTLCLYDFCFIAKNGHIGGCSERHLLSVSHRKLTCPQLMAIGELKRLEIERDKREARKCFVEALDEAVAHAEKLEDEWTDRHYDFNYQLSQEDIEKGSVRVDAYFVNRMWKINQWDDTGAAFHVLKTLPRIANNKNPLKRELVALKKQVDLLCKMHGVGNENTS